jgi:hypothetical protein
VCAGNLSRSWYSRDSNCTEIALLCMDIGCERGIILGRIRSVSYGKTINKTSLRIVSVSSQTCEQMNFTEVSELLRKVA